LERVKTYNIRGGKQKKFSSSKPVYTNSFLAAFALEEKGRYPALMFTHDPTFDPKGKNCREVVQGIEVRYKSNVRKDREKVLR
jgi:hypothetical protein